MILNKKWSIVFSLICIFLLETPLSKAQNTSYADSLFSNKDFKNATLEYERELFIGVSNVLKKNTILLKKANCYKLLNEYDNALATLNRINLFVSNKEFKKKVYTNKALLFMLKKEYKQSIFNLEKIKKALSYKNDLITNILILINKNYLNEWESASIFFKEISSNKQLNKTIVDSIKTMYAKFPKLKKQKAAYLWSFIPGMGIVYAGKTFEGILNFSLNALPLYLGVHQVVNKFYYTGYFGGAILIEKFYFGGRKRAKYLVKKYNYNVSFNYNLKLKELLLSLL